MTARPIYSIRVEDMVSHVEWMLDREDTEVAAGRVELTRYANRPPVSQISMAFARAWQEANQERVRRLLEDLDGLQVEIEVERRQLAGDFIHHADDGCEEVTR